MAIRTRRPSSHLHGERGAFRHLRSRHRTPLGRQPGRCGNVRYAGRGASSARGNRRWPTRRGMDARGVHLVIVRWQIRETRVRSWEEGPMGALREKYNFAIQTAKELKMQG